MGTAYTVSLDTALDGRPFVLAPGTRRKAVEHVIASFPQLSIFDKTKWLELRWNLVKGPEWIPLLRQIVDVYVDFPIQNEMSAYEQIQLTSAALRDWYQIDALGVRRAVIREIERPRPRFRASAIGFLPDPVLSASQHTIAANFINTHDDFAEANLAGGSVVPLLRCNGSAGCVAQNPILRRYLGLRSSTECFDIPAESG